MRALLCASLADAGRGRGVQTTLSLHVDSTGDAFVIFESSQTRPRWVRRSLMRLTLADSDPSVSNRVLTLATRAASSMSAATAPPGGASENTCCLLFDDEKSLKRFTAICNGY